VLAFSPVGEQFRNRCRQFPSIINCCTIDWYNAWPSEALYSVAFRQYKENEVKLGVQDCLEVLSHASVFIH
jgi:dynein heavy chain